MCNQPGCEQLPSFVLLAVQRFGNEDWINYEYDFGDSWRHRVARRGVAHSFQDLDDRAPNRPYYRPLPFMAS